MGREKKLSTDQVFENLNRKRGRPASVNVDKEIAIAIDTEYMSLAKVADKWGIDERVVRRCRDKQSADFLAEVNKRRKIQLGELLWDQLYDTTDLAHDMIRKARTGEAKVTLRELSMHIGIVYDKLALIRGEGQAVQTGGVNIVMNIPETMDPIKLVES